MITFKVILIIAVLVILLSSTSGKGISFHTLWNKNLPEPVPKSKATTVTEFIEQKIDHFNPQNSNTFKMKYLRNDEFFQHNSPIIIFLGGEWPIADNFIVGGRTYDIAKDLNAQLFYTEHRYYGESLPTPNASAFNLRYLTIEQSLADVAHFIVEVKKEPGKEHSKVAVVGGSYSGTMAAWLRQKYPHLVNGAWASSAPVNTKVDFYEYGEVAGASIRHIGGEKCYSRIERGIKSGEELVEKGDFKRLSELFKLCDFDTNVRQNIRTLFQGIITQMWVVVQNHRPGDIEALCTQILDDKLTNSTELEEFARWFTNLFFNDDNNPPCIDIDYYETIVKPYQNEEWGTPVTYLARQWTYQACTEFGWFQSTNSSHHPFGTLVPVDFYLQMCEDIFGKDFASREQLQRNILQMNERYGGFNPAVTNVYFTQGKVDPWRMMGIQEDLNPTAPADVVPTASHGQDLLSIGELGPETEEMLAVKLRVKDLMIKWLN